MEHLKGYTQNDLDSLNVELFKLEYKLMQGVNIEETEKRIKEVERQLMEILGD